MKIEEFWKKKEKEIQEKIIHKYMVQYLSGYRSFSGPLWGIFFFTKQAVYFQTFPKKNWLSVIWNTETENSEKKSPLNFRIPWNEITKITFPEERSKIKKLFSRPESLIILNYINQEGSPGLRLLFYNNISILKENFSLLRINKISE